jgi:hypothetical protein
MQAAEDLHMLPGPPAESPIGRDRQARRDSRQEEAHEGHLAQWELPGQ